MIEESDAKRETNEVSNPGGLGETAVRLIDRIEEADRLAYNLTCAAYALCISKRTLRREIIRGHIRILDCNLKLIARDELVRWVRERTPKPVPRRRAKRINRFSA